MNPFGVCILETHMFLLIELGGTARYAGLLLAPAQSFGLLPMHLLALWGKKGLFWLVLLVFGVVPLVNVSSNLNLLLLFNFYFLAKEKNIHKKSK